MLYRAICINSENNNLIIKIPDLAIQFELPKAEYFNKGTIESTTRQVVNEYIKLRNECRLPINLPGTANFELFSPVPHADNFYMSIDAHEKVKVILAGRIFPVLSYSMAFMTNSLYGIFTMYSVGLTAGESTDESSRLAFSLYTSINGLILMMLLYFRSGAAMKAQLVGHKLDNLLWKGRLSPAGIELVQNLKNDQLVITVNGEMNNPSINITPLNVSQRNANKVDKIYIALICFLVISATIDAVTVGVNEYQKTHSLITDAHKSNVAPFPEWFSYILLWLDTICKPATVFTAESSFAYDSATIFYTRYLPNKFPRFFRNNNLQYNETRALNSNVELIESTTNDASERLLEPTA